MRRSLSGHLHDELQLRYDGPIPLADLRLVEEVASAERRLEDSLPAIERAFRRLADDYGDVLRTTARLEASRQLMTEVGGERHKNDHFRCLRRVVDCGEALAKSNAELLKLANEEMAAKI